MVGWWRGAVVCSSGISGCCGIIKASQGTWLVFKHHLHAGVVHACMYGVVGCMLECMHRVTLCMWVLASCWYDVLPQAECCNTMHHTRATHNTHTSKFKLACILQPFNSAAATVHCCLAPGGWSAYYSLHHTTSHHTYTPTYLPHSQDQIAALGPWGGVLFVLTVMTAEMVPLFPTQPLTLASGLLFGPVKVRY